jgi:SMC interacting uncharacterized protein involved in chromosome segregation
MKQYEMNQDEMIELLKGEKVFLTSQLRKLSGIIHRQEEELADLRMANQDLKYQLTVKHGEPNGHSSKND